MKISVSIAGVVVASAVCSALAGFEPHLGWVTIGDAGNRAANAAEAPLLHPPVHPPGLQGRRGGP